MPKFNLFFFLLLVRGCFVPDYERGQQMLDGMIPGPPPSLDYRVGGSYVVQIPGSVRQAAFEPLFEKDNERCSLPHLILDAIIKVKIFYNFISPIIV